MMNYEEGFIATMLARGFAIVVTDYQGLGTPGVHTYLNRVAQGHAVIDAARAALRLPRTSPNPSGPVAFWRYSQGGGAVASAAELAPIYAPDVHLVGVWSGAPPADMSQALPFLDGSFLIGALDYVLNSIIAAYPEAEAPIRDSLTIYGEDLLNRTKEQCGAETVLTFAHQRLGKYRPSAPVLIDHNRFDPLVLAIDWCAQGADTEFWTNEEPPFIDAACRRRTRYAVDRRLCEVRSSPKLACCRARLWSSPYSHCV
jgi:triacylglycerol lipase